MANPTIEKDGVTFTFDDGSVDSVKINKQGNLDESPLPGSDSNNAYVVDFNGVIKTITLTGVIFEAATSRTSSGTVTSIEDQCDWLLDLVDGVQTGYVFNSTYQINKTVYCRKVEFSEVSGEGNRLVFTIELVEGL